ncbi:hypothetical protein V7S43_002101 [Phytophthora oleae]|uniref:Uncharacterized protein n=1 Tax=Phytophthora oleae TaxID=2107226 RepID=A0ABD3G0X8_9STRA
MQAQKLAKQLKAAAAELAVVEKRLETLCGNSQENKNMTVRVEVPRLRVQRERKLAVCESLKTELEEMNATAGLFPEKQLAEIRAFAARVQKKKAYRKRAKQRRRAAASIRRAVGSNTLEKAKQTADDEARISPTEESVESKEAPDEKVCSSPYLRTQAPHSPAPGRKSPNQSLHPETLTIDTLIAVRRAWDAYIVFPQTVGASTIPPHFVPPPPTPTAQWAVYAASCTTRSSTLN